MMELELEHLKEDKKKEKKEKKKMDIARAVVKDAPVPPVKD